MCSPLPPFFGGSCSLSGSLSESATAIGTGPVTQSQLLSQTNTCIQGSAEVDNFCSGDGMQLADSITLEDGISSQTQTNIQTNDCAQENLLSGF